MKDSADIRKINKNKIRRLLWKGGKYTKQNVALETGLSVATCNTLLNELAQSDEVTGEKKQLQEVGPSTVVYQINESYEEFLCISFEMIQKIKTLKVTVLSAIGTILEQTLTDYDILDYAAVADAISEVNNRWVNISQIMIGTPSIAEHGIIRHCDIPELEDTAIVEQLEKQFGIPVHLQNDMHFKVYGYYKKCGSESEIITLANFPSHVLPGTASIHAGTIIKGKNQFAGMVGFLPYGIERKEEIAFLEKDTCRPLISKALASIMAIINPGIILLTGDLLCEDCIKWISNDCLNTIPEEYMPKLVYKDNLDDFYLEGMYQVALDLKGVI